VGEWLDLRAVCFDRLKGKVTGRGSICGRVKGRGTRWLHALKGVRLGESQALMNHLWESEESEEGRDGSTHVERRPTERESMKHLWESEESEGKRNGMAERIF
jgi:hypothetical protein